MIVSETEFYVDWDDIFVCYRSLEYHRKEI